MRLSTSLLLAAVLGLLLAALMSAWLVRHLRRQGQAQARREALHAALARYALWVAALRSPLLAPSAGSEEAERDAALAAGQALLELQSLQLRHLPQAEPEMARLRQADAALRDFLASQQTLLQHHAEAWLASDHEARLARLALRLQAAVEALETALRQATEGGGASAR